MVFFSGGFLVGQLGFFWCGFFSPPKFSANFLQYCNLVLCDDEACVSMERKLLGGAFTPLKV